MIDTIILKEFSSDIHSFKKEGVRSVYLTIKTKDRRALKDKIEAYLKRVNMEFSEVSTSKSGFPATKINNYHIIYKPIIARGEGGRQFEAEFEKDMNSLLGSDPYNIDYSEFMHADVVRGLTQILPNSLISSSTAKVIHEGSKNQRRAISFVANKFVVNNSTGSVLTDVTVEDPLNMSPDYVTISDPPAVYHFSLKMSKTYYLINARIDQYFRDKRTQVAAYEFFGLDGEKMGEYDNLLNSTKAIYKAKTRKLPESTVKNNIAGLIKSSFGNDYYFVHKKQNNSVTIFYVDDVQIRCSMIESVVYPEKGKRKYTAIKTRITVDGAPYVCTLQFRGTNAGDVEPKYLRILMEKK